MMLEERVIFTFQNQPLVITLHAIEQFERRWLEINPWQPWKERRLAVQAISKLLTQAKQERLSPVRRVQRIMNNHFTEANYWKHQGWRFVIVQHDDGERVLVTIERAYKHV